MKENENINLHPRGSFGPQKPVIGVVSRTQHYLLYSLNSFIHIFLDGFSKSKWILLREFPG